MMVLLQCCSPIEVAERHFNYNNNNNPNNSPHIISIEADVCAEPRYYFNYISTPNNPPHIILFEAVAIAELRLILIIFKHQINTLYISPIKTDAV